VEAAALSGGRDQAARELIGHVLPGLERGSGGWGPGCGEDVRIIESWRAERALQRALQKLLRRVFSPAAGCNRFTAVTAPVVTVEPSRDRRAASRQLMARRFGAPAPLLFRGEVNRRLQDRTAATIYIDVSGSMAGLIERVHAALAPLHRMLASQVFAFSGDVVPTPVARFVRGEITTSWGTAIEPVLVHSAARARGVRRGGLQRALVVTDGYFAPPRTPAVHALLGAGVELHVAIIGDGPLPEGHWVAGATRLPSPEPATWKRES
jgi:hypothetical protein